MGNPYVELFKILGLAVKKRKYPLPADANELYEVEDEYYVKNAIHRMPHTSGQRWLDHAAIEGPGITHKKTVTQVEEIKQLGRLLPVALVAIIYQCIYGMKVFLRGCFGGRCIGGVLWNVVCAVACLLCCVWMCCMSVLTTNACAGALCADAIVYLLHTTTP